MSSAGLAQAPNEAFHWVSFHDPKDAQAVQWVTRELTAEKWSEIREIGILWDSAVVITSLRAGPQSVPSSDAYTVWSVSLAKHSVQPLLHGANARLLAWTAFGGASSRIPELGLVWNDCAGCDAPSTFFTTLYYNPDEHAWRGRWMRGDQGVALYSAGTVEGVTRTQVYGLLTAPPDRQMIATWSHYDYGKTKPAEDYVFQYSVDPLTGLEQTQGLSGEHAEAMEHRLCQANPGQIDPALKDLAAGQDSVVCTGVAPAAKAKERPTRRPVTTPPANNHGQSSPPGVKPH